VFQEWQHHASESGSLSRINAMCVSTVDAEGRPHGRFVDLKEVRREGFVFCTSYLSPKAQHIEERPDVSLSFWWDHVGRQVRVLGRAARISPDEADVFFAERSREAQLASWVYEQSRPFPSSEMLAIRTAAMRARIGSGAIPRPPHWGGYLVAPASVEFLTFSMDRAHARMLYEWRDSQWFRSELQP
jgi:pyridoxamine 5'-phosphate oxidase